MEQPAAVDTLDFRIPFRHWAWDGAGATLLFIVILLLAFLPAAGIAFGAYKLAATNLWWILPVVALVSFLIMIPLARGRVGCVWRMSDQGLERGRWVWRHCMRYERIRMIAFERAGSRDAHIRVRGGMSTLVVYLAARDLNEMFHALLQVCENAGAIDDQGVSHAPKAAESNMGLLALRHEWRKRGWHRLLLAFAIVFVFAPFLTLMLCNAMPHVDWRFIAIRVLGVAFTLGASVAGFAFAAFREARRAKGMA